MVEFDDKAIEANQARMESDRTGFDSMRREVADLVMAGGAPYDARYRSQGAPSGNTMFDEYAALALGDGVSAFEGFTMPRGQKWQAVALHDEQLMEDVSVLQWLEKVGARVFGMRNDPKSGFVSAAHRSSVSLFGYGEQSMWVDKRYDAAGRFAGFSYQSESVGGVWCDLDAEGNTLRVHRLIVLTAEQVVHKFKEAAPPKAKEAMAAQKPRRDERFEILHVIERNGGMRAGMLGPQGMPWKACYYSRPDKLAFVKGGYRTLRRVVSRFDRWEEESYGRSPAMMVMPSIRGSQVMMQDRVLGTEQAVKPPLLAPDDELDASIVNFGPYGITYGGIDDMGNPRLRPFMVNADLAAAKDLHGEVHAIIDRAFYRDLMQINRELKTHITAARTLEEIGEKGILLAPLARQEGEWFSPMLDVELDLLWEEGLLDDMPPRVAEYFRANGGTFAKYDNNLNRMMQALEAAGYLRTAEQVGSLAQFDPDAVKAFRREYPLAKVIPGLGQVNGIPARWRATDDEKAAQDEAEAAQAQMAAVLEAAPVLAQSAKTAAEAGAIGA